MPIQSAARSFQLLISQTQPIERLARIIFAEETPLPPARQLPAAGARRRIDPWTDAEDVRLLEGVHRFGTLAWGSIAQFVGNSRSKAQCRQRWARGLDPRLSRAPWTLDEDRRLVELVRRHGRTAWTRIAREFGNRCDVQCKYRFRQIVRAQPKPKTMLPPIQQILDGVSQSPPQLKTAPDPRAVWVGVTHV
jgi:hypothetical protein